MSKAKERLLKKQAEREAKIEEKIKNGTARREIFEDRKKKPALPNRLSPFVTPEEELEDRQETVEKAVMVYYRMLSDLLLKLSRIKDPRKPGMIKHKMKVLLVYGILMSMYQIGSRRNANRTISRPVFFENLKAMFPEFDTMPHADTVARLLEKLDASQIMECMVELLKDMMRRKKFKNFMHKKSYLIAVDGTQKYFRDYQWAPECLERHVGGETRIPQYYCYVLESVLILENGIVLPVISEFIENGKYKKDGDKQDCERKGFYRMAWKLKKIFRGTKLCIVADGLYACGPVITVCRKYGWDYMIVLKVDSLPNVWKEALALMKINPENRLKCHWGDREQIYSWANWIEYEYTAGEVKKNEVLNVVIYYESWKEKHSRSSGIVEEKELRYAWLSSREINHIAYKALQAKERLTSRNSKEPTIAEIAKELELPKEAVVFALDAIQDPISLFESVYHDGGDAIYVMDQVKDEKNIDENWLEGISLKEAMRKLNDREKLILNLRFFEGRTQMEVAEEIGISQAQVSRLEKTALMHMKKYI